MFISDSHYRNAGVPTEVSMQTTTTADFMIMVYMETHILPKIAHSWNTLNNALFKVQVLGPAFLAQEHLERKWYFLLKEHANSEAKD